MFDFGFSRVRYHPNIGVLQRWAWSIVFRDEPTEIYHVIRKTGHLRRWGSDRITARAIWTP